MTERSELPALPRTGLARFVERARSATPAMWRAAWVAGLLLTLAAAGLPAVRRTQEARVLVGAREMLAGGSLRGWLVPHVNGRPRLQKPPLAYWTSAAGFAALGVNEWAGRLPSVLAGWATVAVTFGVARRQFGPRAGWLAAAILAGSQLACRLSMLAETDAPAALGVTVAIACLWRGMEPGRRRGAAAGWFHLSSVGVAVAAMSKGPPAAFPLLFLIGACLASRTARPLGRWAASGAPVTLVALAATWWAYVYATVDRGTMGAEVRDLVSGRDHGANPLLYLPMLVVACAPWSAVTALAVARAAARWRRDPRLTVMLVWVLSVFVPLCFVGNKQPHYLLPLMPPLAILTGWFVDRVLRAAPPHRGWRLGTAVLIGTAVLAPLATAVAVLVVTWAARGAMNLPAVVTGVAALAGGLWVLRLASKGPRGWGAAVATCCVLSVPGMVVLCAWWAPSLEVSDSRSIAAEIHRRFDGRPLCFAGDGAYLPVCFTLRRVVPYYGNAGELEAAAAREPGLVALQQTPIGRRGPTTYPSLPAPFVRVGEIGAGAEHMDAYVVAPAGRQP